MKTGRKPLSGCLWDVEEIVESIWVRTLPVIALLLIVCGCGSMPAPDQLPLRSGPEPICIAPCGCDTGTPLSIEFFGASGFRLRRGDDEVLLAPFFSNVSLLRGGPLWLSLESNIDNIHRYLPDVSDAAAIIVGHAHYDHLLDIPHIARHHATRAMVYTSETGAHILAADRLLDARVHSVNAMAWDGHEETEPRWIEVPEAGFRFLAIFSEHAPHFMGQKFLGGYVYENLEELPRSSRGWKEGRTFSFLLEFLTSSGQPEYRIFYQDAAANERIGFPPESARPVDITIPCVAAFHEVRGHPESMVEYVRPLHWMLSHWENFFAPYTQDPDKIELVPATDVAEYVRRLQAAGVSRDQMTLPIPGQTFLYRRCP